MNSVAERVMWLIKLDGWYLRQRPSADDSRWGSRDEATRFYGRKEASDTLQTVLGCAPGARVVKLTVRQRPAQATAKR